LHAKDQFIRPPPAPSPGAVAASFSPAGGQWAKAPVKAFIEAGANYYSMNSRCSMRKAGCIRIRFRFHRADGACQRLEHRPRPQALERATIVPVDLTSRPPTRRRR
jgi:hypothetical protein